ncbi:phosphatidylinositol-4- kinase, partial [Coemansia biformis]
MAQPDLHSLILEELSGILAETRALSTAGALSAAGALEADPVAQKILAQCPALPGSGACTMTRRHENGVLALANLLSHSPADAVCQAALDRVLAYLDALPAYSYRFSPLGVDSVPAEHWFLERLVGRLLQCAAHAPALADTVVDRIWAHINRMVDILQGGDMDRIVVFALPALLGTMDAMETTPFRFRAPDVLRADQLSSRLMGARVADNIHAAVAAARAATTPARRTVSLYLQSNVGLSANHVLAQFLRVLRAVLESRLAVRLVRSGDLDAEHVARKDPRELWDLISQLDAARAANCRSTRLDADDELQPAYARILAFSLQAYADTRALVLRGLPVSPRLAEPASATARSVLATSVAVMCRTLYVGALASLLVGSLDQTLLAGIFEHIGSAHVQHLSSLTVVCLRVLGAVATFFPSSRDAIIGALSRFVAEPPAALVAELPLTGETTADEEALMLPVAAALASCMRPLTAERPRAVSTIHALFNALAVPRADAAARSAHVLRVSRSVILVLSQLALLHRDEEITRLVVGMICAPRFISSLQLVVPVIQRAASVAAIADRTVLVDIVSAALKHIDFGGDTDGPASTSASASATLTELAWRVAGQKDAVEGFLGVALRSFVDASIESPALPKPRRGAAAPLSVYLPILHALVQADGYTMDRDATAEQTLLWRNFWFHMAARGYLTEHSYVVEYGAIYTELAAKSPILVHPSSVNYLETEIEYSSILQREYSEARLARLRQALGPIATPQSQALLRGIGFAQAAFLLAVYRVELARATAGSCSAVLRYFSNSAVTSSALLPAIEAIAGLVIAAYVREATSRKWSIEDSLAAGRPHAADAAGAPGGATPLISAQVRELMVASCHHLELVSQWAQRFVNEVLSAFPQALLERTVVSTLLELVQLVWKSCKAEQDDQFVPVYWFSSRTLGITLQLPDSISYRKALFAQFSACARRWLDMASRAAPMELDALLQVCFAAPCDDDLNSEPHVGRALALEVGNAIRFGTDPAVDVGLPATALPPNASPFTHRLGQREFLRGRIGSGADVGALKQALSAVYSLAKEHPGEPLPEGGVTLREAVDAMSHAAHCVVAAPQVDHELVRLLVWVPLTLLDVGVMRAASHMWTALIVERSDVEMLIMVELTIAWTWLAQQHLGLFSRRFEPRSPFAAKMSYTPSDKSARSRAYAAISLTLAPHLQLIEFVAQRFDAVRHLPYASFGVVSAVLRILQATFDNAERISTNALVRGPLFTLVHLGFKLLKLGFESSPILESRLRDGLYGLAFRWFALPPCWSFSGSKATLAREVQVLIDTRHTVKDDTPVLRTAHAHGDKWAAGTAGVPPPPAQPSVPAQQPVHKSHHTRHLLPHPHLHLRRLNPLSRHHRQTNRAPSGLQGSVNHSGATSASSLND